MQQQQQIIDKCKAVFAVAKQKWPHLNFDKVGIRFDLKGRAAGMACARGGFHSRVYYMRFNRDMLTREAFEHVINDTVPHEIAHIVCFMDPRLGSNHNSGWARVCQQLGGSGARYHKEEVVYGKGYTYEYISTTGKPIRVGDKYHRDIQAGQKLNYRKGGGSLDKSCTYTIVGYQGRTIAPKAPVAPVAPVQQVIMPVNPVPSWKPPVTVVAPTPAKTFEAGASKASISRSIILSGYRAGKSYEEIIAAMIAANGYDRQLARATFKANAPKVGVPLQW